MSRLTIAAMFLLVACTKTSTDGPAATSQPTSKVTVASAAASSSSPQAPAGAPEGAKGMSALEEVEAELRAAKPEGAGDYVKAVALATLYKRGDITFRDLQEAILALKLPPHRLGDPYLLVTPPPPPPGQTFDVKNMPKDWEDNWGVVAQAMYMGQITKEEYVKLHRAAHPTCKH